MSRAVRIEYEGAFYHLPALRAARKAGVRMAFRDLDAESQRHPSLASRMAQVAARLK